MEATHITARVAPCGGPLPELEVPMINTMVSCLGNEHRKLDEHILQLAFTATRVAGDPGEVETYQRTLQVWDDIRHMLWSHLLIEDELVFSWGEAHHAISATLIDTLKNERQEMRKLVAALPALSTDADREPQTAENRSALAQTLLALARTLDSHVERYEGEVLPSILRALFHQ